MTATRLKETALKHFAMHGYAGASLANIAEEVGIKKPSVYAHFKGKDDLFLSVLADAIDAERESIERFLAKSDPSVPLHDRLHGFVQALQRQYETSERSKFMLRMSFMPPEALYAQVMSQINSYLDWMENKLFATFEHAMETERATLSVEPRQAAVAFQCLLDGVLVEMQYGGKERSAKRFDASWPVFWRGISDVPGAV